MKLIILGEPGAGKGTQAMRICERYQIPHISTGDLFRANMKAETELGKEAKTYIDKGLLVPDEVTEKMVLARISEPDCNGGYILDGYPRTIPQADFLWDALTERNEAIDFAINVRVIVLFHLHYIDLATIDSCPSFSSFIIFSKNVVSFFKEITKIL